MIGSGRFARLLVSRTATTTPNRNPVVFTINGSRQCLSTAGTSLALIEQPLKRFPASKDASLSIDATLVLHESMLGFLRFGTPGKELDDLHKQSKSFKNDSKRKLANQFFIASSIQQRVLIQLGSLLGYEPTSEAFINLMRAIMGGVNEARMKSPEDVYELQMVCKEITSVVLERAFGRKKGTIRRLTPTEVRSAAVSLSGRLQDAKTMQQLEQIKKKVVQHPNNKVEHYYIIHEDILIPIFQAVAVEQGLLTNIPEDLSPQDKAYEGFTIVQTAMNEYSYDLLVGQNIAQGMAPLTRILGQ